MNVRTSQIVVFLLAIIAMRFTLDIRLFSNFGTASVAVYFDNYPWQNSINETTAASLEKIDTTEKSLPMRRRVRFIPFPHNTLGSGTDMECQWETKNINNKLGYDWTQRTIYAEGICIPPHLKSSLHIFSTAEAIECLSPIKLIVAGDSYMRQLFIGLADILLSRPLLKGQELLSSARRNAAIKSAHDLIGRRRQMDPSFPDIQFQCGLDSSGPCYGKSDPFSDHCSSCMNNYTEKNEHTVGVVGAGVHIKHKRYSKRDVKSTVDEMNKFLIQVERSIFVSVPSYEMDKVVERKMLDFKGMDDVYYSLLPNLAPLDDQHPFLDVFQLTRSCTMDNCSFDAGGHRSRFVNRWKAQLLLNTLCEYDGEE